MIADLLLTPVTVSRVLGVVARRLEPRMEAAPSGSTLTIGEWRVYPSLDEVWRQGTRIKLEPRTMRLLLTLARRPGELVTTEELLETVWSGVIVTQSSLYQSIAHLRKTLDADPGATSYIATVPRRGYRLVAPVAESVEPEEPVAVHPVPLEAPERPERRWFIRTAAAAATLAAGAGVWWWRARPAAARSPITLAVLPFDESGSRWQRAATRGRSGERGDRRLDRLRRGQGERPGLVVPVPAELTAPHGGGSTTQRHPRPHRRGVPKQQPCSAHRSASPGVRRRRPLARGPGGASQLHQPSSAPRRRGCPRSASCP